MDYVISDTHFYHKNIIKYENRPFTSVEEMNNVIINNWNSIINNSDTVIHLGDVGFSGKDKLKLIIDQLNGNKILILGNHDEHSIGWYLDLGFTEVYKYPIIYNKFIMLSHEPLYVNDSMPYINIHGHLHSKSYGDIKNINVSVELTNYFPVLIKSITSKFREE